MDENNRKGPGIFYAVIGVATLVVAIIGATFAYFSATVEGGSEEIQGNTANVGGSTLTLSVTEVTEAQATGDLIPLKDEDITKALPKNCVDDNGYTACHVYSINIKNTGSVDATMSGSLNLTSTATNMKWKRIETATSEGDVDVANTAQSSGAAHDFVTNQKLVAGTGNETYYVVVWLDETTTNQTDADANKTFTGTVTFSAAGGGQLTATFSA